MREMLPGVEHRQHRYLNNRAENSHQPTRQQTWPRLRASGDATPYVLQHLLWRASCHPEAVRDELRTYVIEHLRETKPCYSSMNRLSQKGRHSAGVARQYSGTAGRIENCQIGVFLAYASRHGHALLDREFYLPTDCTDDLDRCQLAGIPKTAPLPPNPLSPRRCSRVRSPLAYP